MVPKNYINFRFNIERPEQELIAKYLPLRCNVLEIGGESGTASLIINFILEDNYKNKHIVIDPDNSSMPKLQTVKNIYSCEFQIIHGFLGHNRAVHEEIWSDCKNKKKCIV